MIPPEISVCLCTHQPRAESFTRALDGLRLQTLAPERWEFLLIDNASAPPLASDLSWHPRARVVQESTLGLTHARLRAFREASAELLVLVDDDNVLFPDYLERAIAIAEQWPILGSWGGQCLPEFAAPPAEWTRRFWNWIAIREFSSDVWSNVPRDQTAAPCGAGMCLRRRVAMAYAERLRNDRVRQSLDRIGGQLFGGGDTDLALTSCDLGLGNGLFAALKLTHLIPASRLEEGYLVNLVRSMTYSATMLDYFRGERPIRPSRSQRLLKWYQARHISARERRFDEAEWSGRKAAARDIERLERDQAPLGFTAINSPAT
jgi:glycosyltransferase involved in cell wall biosynthesis